MVQARFLSALSRVENIIRKTQQNILFIEKEKQEKECCSTLLLKELKEAEALWELCKKKVREAELESKELLDSLQIAIRKIEACSSMKEHNAIEKERLAIIKRLSELDDTLLSLWEERKSLEEEFKKKKEHYFQQVKELEQEIVCKDQEYKKEQEELNSLKEKQKALLERIEPSFINQYERAKKLFDNPLVEEQAQGCAGCFNTFPLLKMQELKKSGVTTCSSCGRLVCNSFI